MISLVRSLRFTIAACAAVSVAALVPISSVAAAKPMAKSAPAGTKAAAPQAIPPPPVLPDSGLLKPPVNLPISGMSSPALSPHGHRICFTYRGSLWIVGSDGGTAKRLTVNQNVDFYPHWSPDGKWIAFTSLRSGNFDVYLVPTNGGQPRQVTLASSSDWGCDWSADGSHILFYSIGRAARVSGQAESSIPIMQVNLHNLRVRQLTNDTRALRFAKYVPGTDDIVFCRGGEPWWRPWYRGSDACQLMVENVKTGNISAVKPSRDQQFWPMCSPDGKFVYCATIMNGQNTPNIWRLGLRGGGTVQITHYTTDAVRWPDLARDGSLLCYLYDGKICTVKPTGGKPTELQIFAPTDVRVNLDTHVVLHAGATESAVSPDGKTIALVVQGQIWTMPAAGGDAHRLTQNIAHNADIAWSPDSKLIAFRSDAGNQPDLYTIDASTGKTTRLTDDMASERGPTWSPDGTMIAFAKSGSKPGLYVVPGNGSAPERFLAPGNGNNIDDGILSLNWSPDNRWIAYSRSDRFDVTDIWLIPSVGGNPTNITKYPNNNFNPMFTGDGRFLIYVSDRNGPPQLFRLQLEKGTGPGIKPSAKRVPVNFDDITNRSVQINTPAPIQDFSITPDGSRIVFLAGGQFWVIGVNGQALMHIYGPVQEADHSTIQFSSDGRRFFYLDSAGQPQWLLIPPGPPAQPNTIPFNASYTFNRRLIQLQAFNEFYRRFGANFYDRYMHGVDWPKLRDKYEPQLNGVGTPFEFANLLSEMVGEVNSSHSEIAPNYSPSGPITATIGVRYDTNYAGPGLKVLSVVKNGPCDAPHSRVFPGDYILSIDGKPVVMTETYYDLLQDKAGKHLTLVVNNKPVAEGARTITVTATSQGALGAIKLKDLIAKRRAEVDRLSDGKLAYIYIPAMDGSSLKLFIRELDTEALRKQGLIIDIRGNPGGNTHPQLLQALAQRIYGYNRTRDSLVQTAPARAFHKPTVLLINQNSYSDAEVFPSGFRALKLGTIVGVATPGYVIGTRDATLLDGTHFRLPSVGYWDLTGHTLENLGIKPDITVVRTPAEAAAHDDVQLKEAVKVVLQQIEEHPAPPIPTLLPTSANPNGGSSAVPPGSGIK